MSSLPLDDRIALLVSRRARSARTLAGETRHPVADVRTCLDSLAAQGAVERVPHTSPTLWRTSPGVRVAYRPGRIQIVRVVHHEPADQEDGGDGEEGEGDDGAEDGGSTPKGEGGEDVTAGVDGEPDGRWTGTTSQGTRCKLTAKSQGRCSHHAL